MDLVNRLDCNVFESSFNGKFPTGYNFDKFDIKEMKFRRTQNRARKVWHMQHAFWKNQRSMTRAIDWFQTKRKRKKLKKNVLQ